MIRCSALQQRPRKFGSECADFTYFDAVETLFAKLQFNTDQGVQSTARAFPGRLEAAGVAVSRDGRGRALDNVFVERLWRAVKYEEVYLKDSAGTMGLVSGLTGYFGFSNDERPHQSRASAH